MHLRRSMDASGVGLRHVVLLEEDASSCEIADGGVDVFDHDVEHREVGRLVARSGIDEDSTIGAGSELEPSGDVGSVYSQLDVPDRQPEDFPIELPRLVDVVDCESGEDLVNLHVAVIDGFEPQGNRVALLLLTLVVRVVPGGVVGDIDHLTQLGDRLEEDALDALLESHLGEPATLTAAIET